MSDQTNSAESPVPAPSEAGKARRDTVMLSEVPDVAALSSPSVEHGIPDQPQGSEYGPGQSSYLRPNYGSGALAVLSQRYRILAQVGRGYLCVVYKAHDTETGNTVALKLLRPDVAFDPASLDRFKSDVLLAAEITHPNICRTYEVHLLNGTACVCMHFVDGESLRSMLNRSGGLPLRKGIDLTLQLCAGLAEAHGFGIVHGDLKPENVMIDPRGTAKITDFLFAPLPAAVRWITGAPATRSPYTAPERAEGKPLDRRADIFSLGVLLHEIFTGRLPVSTEIPDGSLSKLATHRLALARDVDTSIPVSLERVILKCLEADPARRYQTVVDLQNDLSSSGLRAILPSGSEVGTRTTLSNREAIAHPEAMPISSPRPRPRGLSLSSVPVLGILLGVLAILGMLGIFQVASIVRSTRSIVPPSALAPHPPALALEKAAQQNTSSRSEPARTQIPAFDEPPSPITNPNASDASPNSSSALDDVSPGQAKSASRESASSGAGAENYIWIGRFEIQSGAQETASQIEAHGFPAVIVPRRNPKGDFFVVLSGPFSPSQASSALDELQAEGFANIHVIKNLALSQ